MRELIRERMIEVCEMVKEFLSIQGELTPAAFFFRGNECMVTPYSYTNDKEKIIAYMALIELARLVQPHMIIHATQCWTSDAENGKRPFRGPNRQKVVVIAGFCKDCEEAYLLKIEHDENGKDYIPGARQPNFNASWRGPFSGFFDGWHTKHQVGKKE